MGKEIYLLVILVLFALLDLNAQSTTFTGTGNWQANARWSNDRPTNTDDATISALSCTVSGGPVAECKDLTLTLGTVTINSSRTLTIYGDLSIGLLTSIVNDGQLTILGDISYNGSKKIEIEGGLEFGEGVNFELNQD